MGHHWKREKMVQLSLMTILPSTCAHNHPKLNLNRH